MSTFIMIPQTHFTFLSRNAVENLSKHMKTFEKIILGYGELTRLPKGKLEYNDTKNNR